MMKLYVVLATLALSVVLFSCQDKDKNGKPLDTATSGSIRIVADESLRPLIETEVEVFNSLYTRAHIDVDYLSEVEAIDRLMSDCVKVAVVTRPFLKEEWEYYKKLKINPDTVWVATSSVALIVNQTRQDSLISVDQIQDILQGKTTRWKQLGSKKDAGIEIVFDNPTSGLVRYLKDSIADVDSLPSNCYAVNNNEAVVDYVLKNENAIGLIGVEWISDDPVTNTFLKKVRVMGVKNDSTHFKPYQAYMALKYYPLLRRIYVLNRETRTGLGHGFGSFLASERGQRIILKTGLVPVKMPVRIIQVNPKPFEVTK